MILDAFSNNSLLFPEQAGRAVSWAGELREVASCGHIPFGTRFPADRFPSIFRLAALYELLCFNTGSELTCEPAFADRSNDMSGREVSRTYAASGLYLVPCERKRKEIVLLVEPFEDASAEFSDFKVEGRFENDRRGSKPTWVCSIR